MAVAKIAMISSVRQGIVIFTKEAMAFSTDLRKSAQNIAIATIIPNLKLLGTTRPISVIAFFLLVSFFSDVPTFVPPSWKCCTLSLS